MTGLPTNLLVLSVVTSPRGSRRLRLPTPSECSLCRCRWRDRRGLTPPSSLTTDGRTNDLSASADKYLSSGASRTRADRPSRRFRQTLVCVWAYVCVCASVCVCVAGRSRRYRPPRHVSRDLHCRGEGPGPSTCHDIGIPRTITVFVLRTRRLFRGGVESDPSSREGVGSNV